jgi:hypothetical protein
VRVLVLGGGPSVNEAIELVPKDWPECVISANEHGFKTPFKVDYIACVDPRHGRTFQPMKKYMAQFGVPIISYQEYADVPLTEPRMGRNSGFVAIQAAVQLRAHTIVVAGIDCTVGPRPYFWHTYSEGEKALRYGPGVKERAARFAEYYAAHNIYRMPSMTVWPWPIWSNE